MKYFLISLFLLLSTCMSQTSSATSAGLDPTESLVLSLSPQLSDHTGFKYILLTPGASKHRLTAKEIEAVTTCAHNFLGGAVKQQVSAPAVQEVDCEDDDDLSAQLKMQKHPFKTQESMSPDGVLLFIIMQVTKMGADLPGQLLTAEEAKMAMACVGGELEKLKPAPLVAVAAQCKVEKKVATELDDECEPAVPAGLAPVVISSDNEEEKEASRSAGASTRASDDDEEDGMVAQASRLHSDPSVEKKAQALPSAGDSDDEE